MMEPAVIQPEEGFEARGRLANDKAQTGCLIIGCGALANELVTLIKQLNLEGGVSLSCLPANYHNYPERIVPELEQKLTSLNAAQYNLILIAYGDCGTGGALDRLIETKRKEHLNIHRIAGEHCYRFFSGHEQFEQLNEDALGTFYLTDYLARFFNRLIVEGFKLDKHPQLKDQLFQHYTKLVYLAQTHSDALDAKAEEAAKFLGLEYQRIQTGYGELAGFIEQAKQALEE